MSENHSNASRKRWKWGAAIGALGCGFVLAIVIAGGLGYSLGALLATRDVYHARYVAEEAILLPKLRGTHEFDEVRVEEASRGFAVIVGKVSSKETFLMLQAIVDDALGTQVSDDRFTGVEIRAD